MGGNTPPAKIGTVKDAANDPNQRGPGRTKLLVMSREVHPGRSENFADYFCWVHRNASGCIMVLVLVAAAKWEKAPEGERPLARFARQKAAGTRRWEAAPC